MGQLDTDFERAFGATGSLLPVQGLQGCRIFLTGGTGFFGSWIIESFLWLKKQYDLGDAKIVILSRNPSAFLARFPRLTDNSASIEFIQGDICDFRFPEGNFSHVIHAATPVVARDYPDEELLRIIDQGTERVLKFAKKASIRHLLFTSSGAVYGPQPQELKLMPEEWVFSPDSKPSVYGIGKRAAEARCISAYHEGWLSPVIARCYAFIGPYLALDSHLAAACFTRNALEGVPIQVGNGRTVRSYLYGADLSVWLWNLLLRGRPAHPYHIGSDEEYSLMDVAKEFAKQANTSVSVRMPDSQGTADRYVPSVRRAKEELGLVQSFDLSRSVEQTLNWHSRNKK